MIGRKRKLKGRGERDMKGGKIQIRGVPPFPLYWYVPYVDSKYCLCLDGEADTLSYVHRCMLTSHRRNRPLMALCDNNYITSIMILSAFAMGGRYYGCPTNT